MQNRWNIVNPKVFPEHMCTNQNLCKQRDKQFQIYLTSLSDHQLSSLLQTDPYLLWSAPDQPDVNQLLVVLLHLGIDYCCQLQGLFACLQCSAGPPAQILHCSSLLSGVLGLPLQPVWPCPLSWCAPTPQSTLVLLLYCYKTSYRRSATENNQFFIFYFVLFF